MNIELTDKEFSAVLTMEEITLLQKSVYTVGHGGSIQLLDAMGDELNVVNSARTSFAKQKYVLDESDVKLIKYLMKEKHYSTLRHNFVSFRLVMPLFVSAQLKRYTIGSNFGKDYGLNEESRRYVESEPEFWSKPIFRSRSASNKQGSSVPLPENVQLEALEIYDDVCDYILECYNNLLRIGVAPEQARMVLPMSFMTTAIWSMSLQSLIHFLHERLDGHTQRETMLYAIGAYELTKSIFPNVFDASKLEEKYIIAKEITDEVF